MKTEGNFTCMTITFIDNVTGFNICKSSFSGMAYLVAVEWTQPEWQGIAGVDRFEHPDLVGAELPLRELSGRVGVSSQRLLLPVRAR